MFCAKCGAKLDERQNFCSACGEMAASRPVAPPMPDSIGARGRLNRHLRILVILWAVWSALHLVPAIFLIFGRFAFPFFFPFHFHPFWMPFAAVAGGFGLAYAVAGLIAAWGLSQRLAWARLLVIVLGVIALIHVPIGTALGIYTLWVMWPRESESAYAQLSGRS